MLKSAKVNVVFSGVNAEVLKDFNKNNITDLIPHENIYDAFEQALGEAKKMIKTETTNC